MIPAEFRRFPKQWKVLPFLKVFKDATSGNKKIKKEDFLEEGSLPIVDQGQVHYGGFTNNIGYAVDSELPSIVFGDHTRAFKFVEEPFALGADGAKLLEPIVDADKKYLFYYLKQLRLEAAGYSRHYKFLKETYIPLPPLAIQKQIAAVLEKADTLRSHCQQMEQELNALAQSVFLDMFGDPVKNPKGWPKNTIANIVRKPLQNGAYYEKEHYTDDGAGVEMAHMGDTFYGKVKRGCIKRVNASDKDIKKYSITNKDILVARRSLVYDGAAKPCMIPDGKEPLIYESSMICVSPNLDHALPEFLFHYLSNDRARAKYLLQYVTKSTISGINQTNLSKVEVLLPPIELQASFVDKVNSIDELKSQVAVLYYSYNNNFNSLIQRAFKGELKLKGVA